MSVISMESQWYIQAFAILNIDKFNLHSWKTAQIFIYIPFD